MKKTKNTFNDFGGLMYSTNPDFEFEKQATAAEETPEPKHQSLRVQLDKKQRAGKKVTLVTGFVGREEHVQALGKMLKSKCGVGGSVKDFEVMIQGDFCDKVIQILQGEGYKVKKIGG